MPWVPLVASVVRSCAASLRRCWVAQHIPMESCCDLAKLNRRKGGKGFGDGIVGGLGRGFFERMAEMTLICFCNHLPTAKLHLPSTRFFEPTWGICRAKKGRALVWATSSEPMSSKILKVWMRKRLISAWGFRQISENTKQPQRPWSSWGSKAWCCTQEVPSENQDIANFFEWTKVEVLVFHGISKWTMWFAWLAYLCVYHIHIWGLKFMVEPLAWRKHIFPTWGPGKISSLSRFVADVAPWCPRTQRWDVKLPHQSDSADVKKGKGMVDGKWWRVGCWLGMSFLKLPSWHKLTMDLEVWAVETTPWCKEMRFKPSFLLSDHTYSNFFFKNQNADPWLTWKPKVLIDLKCMFPKLLSEAGW